jgi:acyl carrier protein
MTQPDQIAPRERSPEAKVIDVQAFIRNLEAHLDTAPPVRLDPETRFHELPEWTSLQALLVVASFEWDYGVTVSADEFARAEKIRDLFDLVVGRMPQ